MPLDSHKIYIQTPGSLLRGKKQCLRKTEKASAGICQESNITQNLTSINLHTQDRRLSSG